MRRAESLSFVPLSVNYVLLQLALEASRFVINFVGGSSALFEASYLKLKPK